MESKKREKVRKTSLRWKIALPVFLLFILICLLMTLFASSKLKHALIDVGCAEAEVIGNIAIPRINIDDLNILYKNTDVELKINATASRVQFALNLVKEQTGIMNLYTLYTDGSKVYHGVDAVDSNARWGEEYKYSYSALKKAFEGGVAYVQNVDKYMYIYRT